jgi:hypothetical protein
MFLTKRMANSIKYLTVKKDKHFCFLKKMVETMIFLTQKKKQMRTYIAFTRNIHKLCKNVHLCLQKSQKPANITFYKNLNA